MKQKWCQGSFESAFGHSFEIVSNRGATLSARGGNSAASSVRGQEVRSRPARGALPGRRHREGHQIGPLLGPAAASAWLWLSFPRVWVTAGLFSDYRGSDPRGRFALAAVGPKDSFVIGIGGPSRRRQFKGGLRRGRQSARATRISHERACAIGVREQAAKVDPASRRDDPRPTSFPHPRGSAAGCRDRPRARG